MFKASMQCKHLNNLQIVKKILILTLFLQCNDFVHE